MEQKKIFAVIVVAVLLVAGIAAIILLGDEGKAEDVVGENVDFVGREIQVVEDLDNGIVAIGQDSFRWMTYFGLADKCIMIDINDRTNFMGKTFMYYGRALADVDESDANDFSHINCGITPADVANILNAQPSIVIAPEGFITDYPNEYKSLVDGGLNVLSIGYIYTFLEPETFKIVDSLKAQVNLLSKALNLRDRGDELITSINSFVADIRGIAATATVNKSAYIGALAYNGAHGADSSIAYYMPFALAGVNNILAGEEMDMVGSGVSTYSATKIKESIDAAEKAGSEVMLFLDATGLYMCSDMTSKGILQMFEGHDAYVAFPYIWTGINYENILISAYQILKDAYGLLTQEQFEAKVNAVLDGFLGSHMSNRDMSISQAPSAPTTPTTIYDDMNNVYMGRRANPVYGEITIDSGGSMTFGVPA